MSMPSSRVPLPISSRKAPSRARVHSMPTPMNTPSRVDCSGGFLAAKASTRASTMQLVTMSGMKMPSTRYSACSWALKSRSTTVTRAATIRMNTGMRISWGIQLRRLATATLARAITRMVARESITPFTKLVVTASRGHRPRIWTRLVFWRQTPFWAILRNSSWVIIGPPGQRVRSDGSWRSGQPGTRRRKRHGG